MERLEEFEQELEIKSERVERKEKEMDNLKLCLERRGQQQVKEINPADIQLLEAQVVELQRQNELLRGHNHTLRNKQKKASNPGSISLSRNSSLMEEEEASLAEEEKFLKSKIQDLERAIQKRQESLIALEAGVNERKENCFRLKEMLETLEIERGKNGQDKLRMELLGHQLKDKICCLEEQRGRLQQEGERHRRGMAEREAGDGGRNESMDKLMWEIGRLKKQLKRLREEVGLGGCRE